MSKNTKMKNKIAVITGANRGLGLGIARGLIAKPDEKYFTPNKNEELDDYNFGSFDTVIATARNPAKAKELMELKKEVETYGKKLIIAELDVGDEKSIKECAKFINNNVDHVDCLINNAGLMVFNANDSLETTNYDDVLDSLKINSMGPLFVTKELLPLIRKGDLKKVIHITSVSGSHALPFGGQSAKYFAYKTSKSALNMVTAVMAHELEEENILVAAINPGGVNSQSAKDKFGGGKDVPGFEPPNKQAAKVINIMSHLNLKDHSGKYINHRYLDKDDKEYKTFLPW